MTSPMTPKEKIARAIGYAMASIVSGNNMPCMSGDPRDRLSPLQRKHFDRGCDEAATAALAALEPDEEMIEAGEEAWNDWHRDPQDERSLQAVIFTAMIRQAMGDRE